MRPAFEAVDSPHLVADGDGFRVSQVSTERPGDGTDKADRERMLAERIEELAELQRMLYAQNRHALLLVFQAMDAAGKDSTIRAVLSGINPAGCQVFSFKRPSAEELDHDFLWRTSCRLPERGRIGVFNRSYYEEVLVVRVHPEILAGQPLPDRTEPSESLWKERYRSIVEHERHLAASGTVILKFWLNVSREEQKERFLARLDEPEKNWKFAVGDVRERGHWDEYMHAYEEAIAATARPWAPWYAIPADSKSYMRLAVADIVARTLKSLRLEYPTVDAETRARFDEMRSILEAGG